MARSLIVTVLLGAAGHVSAGLLGAGEGEGSCAAPPFRAKYVQWTGGCPGFAPCCSEFGYCRPLSEWQYGEFRDCNGVSNGSPLPEEVVLAEEAAGHYGAGAPAGEVGPPPDVIAAHHAAHGDSHDHLPPPDHPPYHAPAPHHLAAHAPPHHAVHHPAHPAAHTPVPHAVAPIPVAPVPHPLAHAPNGPHTVAHSPLAAVTAAHPLAHPPHAVQAGHHAVAHAPLAALPVPHPVAHVPIPVGPVAHPEAHAALALATAPVPNQVPHVAHGVTPVAHHTAHAVAAPVHHTGHHPSHVAHAIVPVDHTPVEAHHAAHQVSHPAIAHTAPLPHTVHAPVVAHPLAGHPTLHAAAPAPVESALPPTHAATAEHAPLFLQDVPSFQQSGPTVAHKNPAHHHSISHPAQAPAFVHHAASAPATVPVHQPLVPAVPVTPIAHHAAQITHQALAHNSVPVPVHPQASLPPHSVPAQLPAHVPAAPISAPALASTVPVHHSSHNSVLHGGISQQSPVQSAQLSISPGAEGPLFTTPAPTFPVTRDTLQTSNSEAITTQAPPSQFSTPSPLQSFSSGSSLPLTPSDSAAVLGAAGPVTNQPQTVVSNKIAQLSSIGSTPAAINNFGSPVQLGASSNGKIPQTAPITIPRIPINDKDSKCQHPKGSGSYTCLSFGAPQRPIFAFHQVQDQDGVIFGTGSGFPNEDEILNEVVPSQSAVRKIRKVLVKKEDIRKKYFQTKSKEAPIRRTYDFNSEKKKRMVTYPIPNKLLLDSSSEDNVMFDSSVQKYEYPLV